MAGAGLDESGDARSSARARRRQPNRLRDLDDRERLVALALLVLLLVPFVVAVVRALHDGWIPSGDEANVATRALDVFSRHPPLTGLPSTSYKYGDRIFTNHPGPMEFYLLAIPLRALGSTLGPLLTAAAINAALSLIVVWVFHRRLGFTAMLGAGLLMLGVMWSGGSALLVDTLSSNMTTYSLLCTAVLAWALVDGDFRLLPLAAVVASYAAQQHLEAGLIVLVLGAAVVVALFFQSRRLSTTATRARIRPWLLVALGIAAMCWLPVLDDQLRGHPGNLTRIVDLARDHSQPNLGYVSGVYELLHALAPPTILGRTDVTGAFFLDHLGVSWFTLGFAVIGALVVIAWRARSPARSVLSLALVSMVLIVAGVVDGANVPNTIERYRVNEYRWSWAAAFMAFATLGAGAALLLRRVRESQGWSSTSQRFVPVALLVACALVTTAIVVVQGPDDHNRSLREFALEKRVNAAVLAHIDRHQPVVVVPSLLDAHTSIAPALIFRLLRAGVRVEVPPAQTSTYGAARRYRARSHPGALVVTSGPVGQASFVPGTLLTSQLYSAERTKLLDELAAGATGQKVALAPGAREIIERDVDPAERSNVNAMLGLLPSQPRVILASPTFLRLVDAGLLRAPVFDRAKIRRLMQLPAMTFTTLSGFTGLYGDEQVRVYYLTPEQLRAHPLPGL